MKFIELTLLQSISRKTIHIQADKIVLMQDEDHGATIFTEFNEKADGIHVREKVAEIIKIINA